MTKEYLGDGVYAEYDGWQIVLTGNALGRDNVIAIEPAVWPKLQAYAAKHLGKPRDSRPLGVVEAEDGERFDQL